MQFFQFRIPKMDRKVSIIEQLQTHCIIELKRMLYIPLFIFSIFEQIDPLFGFVNIKNA